MNMNGNGRVSNGHYAKKRNLRFTELLEQAVTDDDFREVVQAVLLWAKTGAPWACRLLFDRLMGRVPIALTMPVNPEDQARDIIEVKNRIHEHMRSLEA